MTYLENHDGKSRWLRLWKCTVCGGEESVVLNITPEQADEARRVFAKLESIEDEIQRTSLSILVWGPALPSIAASGSAALDDHQRLRAELLGEFGKPPHFATTSEALLESGHPTSVLGEDLYDQEFVQASAVDCILVVATSIGAIGEVTLFSMDDQILRKMIVIAPEAAKGGFLGQGWYQKLADRVLYFGNEDLKNGRLMGQIRTIVARAARAKFYRQLGIDRMQGGRLKFGTTA
jgi:hypothetical protein